jgi:hypothetical protein
LELIIEHRQKEVETTRKDFTSIQGHIERRQRELKAMRVEIDDRGQARESERKKRYL